MPNADRRITVQVRDRVTFDTQEGIQVGYVNDLRRDLGNGELHAWVELEHHLLGCFRTVPVSAILTADQVGPPSSIYLDWTQCAPAVTTSVAADDTVRRLARAERAFLSAGFTDYGGEERWQPITYWPIEVIDESAIEHFHQSDLDEARSGTELARILAATPPVMTYERAVEFANKNAVLVENTYIAHTREHIDHGAAYAIAVAMATAHI